MEETYINIRLPGFFSKFKSFGNTGKCEAGHYPQSGSYCTVSAGGVQPSPGKVSQKSEGVKEEEIVCGNGAAEVIFTLCRAVNPKRALIPAPTLQNTDRLWQALAVSWNITC